MNSRINISCLNHVGRPTIVSYRTWILLSCSNAWYFFSDHAPYIDISLVECFFFYTKALSTFVSNDFPPFNWVTQMRFWWQDKYSPTDVPFTISLDAVLLLKANSMVSYSTSAVPTPHLQEALQTDASERALCCIADPNGSQHISCSPYPS